MQKNTYRLTFLSSCLGYLTQAIIVNYPPLLFAALREQYNLTLEQIGLLVTVEFVVQIGVDFVASRLGDRLRYRSGAVAANAFAALGLVGMCVLPDRMPPYVGLMLAVILMSIGGGLIEVLITPIVAAIPAKENAGRISLLHSFYCWGSMLTVAASTVLFRVCGIGRWRMIALMWMLIPAITALLFTRVALPPQPPAATRDESPLRTYLGKRTVWLLMLLMVSAGATELSISQWASFLAEQGLGVSKAMGDLLGPCAFAFLMGAGRLWLSRVVTMHNLPRILMVCGVGCLLGYALIALSPLPVLSLGGICLVGLSVSLLWPGTISLCTAYYPHGGTALFALMALCGDIGCSVGPAWIGFVSGSVTGQSVSDALRVAFAAALIFPLLIPLGTFLLRKGGKDK